MRELSEGRRARSVGEKQQRRTEILEAAWHMFRNESYDAVTMANIASALSLVKGTVYLYFKTKEELFLELHSEQLGAWFDTIDDRLRTEVTLTPESGALLIADSLRERHDLRRLLAILATVLEHNVDYTSILRFKRRVHERLVGTAALLESRMPFLTAGDGVRVLFWLHALVVGLHHVAEPAPVVARVLNNPDLAMFKIDFATEIRGAMHALLAGLATSRRGVT